MKVLAATLVTLLLLATLSPAEGHLGESSIALSSLGSPSPIRVAVGRVGGDLCHAVGCRFGAGGCMEGMWKSLEGAEAVLGSHQGHVCVPCPHRWCPQHVLLQLPEAAHPSAPCQLRLCHQQLLQPAGRDVSTQQGQHSGGPGDTRGTLGVLLVALRSCCPSPAAQGSFVPAVWSPRRRSRCVQIHGQHGCSSCRSTSRAWKTEPSLLPATIPPLHTFQPRAQQRGLDP